MYLTQRQELNTQPLQELGAVGYQFATTDRNYYSESFPATDQNSKVALHGNGNVYQLWEMWRELERISWKHKLDLISLPVCLLIFKLLLVCIAKHLNTSNKLASRRVPGRCSVNISWMDKWKVIYRLYRKSCHPS